MTPEQLNALSNVQTQPSVNLPHSPVANSPNAEIDSQLQLLADIHLPDAISWWPPAPGWWLVLVLSLTFCYLLYHYIYRYIKKKLRQSNYKNQAKQELQIIQRHWQKQHNLILTASRLSIFLRRLALTESQLTINPHRENIASLTDVQWLSYIQKQNGMQYIDKNYYELLIKLPYQDPLIKFDMDEQKKFSKQVDTIFNVTSQWIKKGFQNA